MIASLGRITGTSIGHALAFAALAQPQWSAQLPAVEQDGYYTILLSPEVVGRSYADLGDLRVLDTPGQEVPYVLEREPLVYERTWMRTYKLLRNEREDKRTIIEMEADSAVTVDELQLHIRNAEVSKRARITGSDDRATWYMIKDECLSVGEGAGTTSVLRFMDLPLSDYRFYRIELNDKRSAPVQVLELGHSARARSEGRYTNIVGLRFARVEDRRTSRIALFGTSPYKADRIAFEVRSDVPFQRSGSFSKRSAYITKEHRREVKRMREERIGSFILASSGRGVVAAPGTIVDTLWVNIENQNDRPLEIAGIRAFQLEHRLITRLKAGERYRITTGDAKARAPHYDLELFRDSIPASLAVLNMPQMTAVPVATKDDEPSFAPGMKWVWGAIIGIGVIIAISAVRLLRKGVNTEPS